MELSKHSKKYIDKAISVFKQNGLRLSLEEVATKMGVTKKTIYNHFSTKDELLQACIQSISHDFQQTFSSLDAPEHSAIENLRNGFTQIDRFFTELSPLFFHDIMLLNFNLAMSEHLSGSGLFRAKLEANLKQGIREGIYRPELNTAFASQYLSYSIFGFYINNIIRNPSVIPNNYFSEVVTLYLSAFVSENGRSLL